MGKEGEGGHASGRKSMIISLAWKQKSKKEELLHNGDVSGIS